MEKRLMTWIEDQTQAYPSQDHDDHDQCKDFVCNVERKGSKLVPPH